MASFFADAAQAIEVDVPFLWPFGGFSFLKMFVGHKKGTGTESAVPKACAQT
jgi:hypothetical protein